MNGGSSEQRPDRTKGGKGSVPSPSPHQHVLLEKKIMENHCSSPPPSVASVSTVMQNMKSESPELLSKSYMLQHILRGGNSANAAAKGPRTSDGRKKRIEGRSGHCRRDELEMEDRRTGAHGESA